MLRLFSFLVACSLILTVSSSPSANAINDSVKWSSVTVRKDAEIESLPSIKTTDTPLTTSPTNSKPAANAPAASNGDLFLTNLDAATCEELKAKLRKLHDEFLASNGQPLEGKDMRPIFAPTDVVNSAFRDWIGEKPDFQVCKDQQHEAIFASPPECMRKSLVPGKLPKVVNPRRARLNKRNDQGCIYTTVRCVSADFFNKTADDLLRELQKQNWNQPYFAPEKLFAPKVVVEEAWKKWNQVRLGGVEGIKTDGCICGKPKNELAIQDGSYLAIFANTAECAKKPDPPCRTISVECV
jgi:hypothetical protein